MRFHQHTPSADPRVVMWSADLLARSVHRLLQSPVHAEGYGRLHCWITRTRRFIITKAFTIPSMYCTRLTSTVFFLNRKHLPASRSAALPDQTSWSAPAVPQSAFWICSMIGTSESRAPVHPSNGHVRDLIKELHLEHLNSLLHLLCHPKERSQLCR